MPLPYSSLGHFSLSPLSMIIMWDFLRYPLSSWGSRLHYWLLKMFLPLWGVRFSQMLLCVCLLKQSCEFCPLSVDTVYYIVWFSMLNQGNVPGIHPILLWYVIPFLCCWILFVSVLLRILVPIVITNNWSLSFWFTFAWFWFHSNTALMKWLGKCYLCFILVEIVKD